MGDCDFCSKKAETTMEPDESGDAPMVCWDHYQQLSARNDDHESWWYDVGRHLDEDGTMNGEIG